MWCRDALVITLSQEYMSGFVTAMAEGVVYWFIGRLKGRQGPEICYQVFESNPSLLKDVIERSFKHRKKNRVKALFDDGRIR
jgi:hypothetical protein